MAQDAPETQQKSALTREDDLDDHNYQTREVYAQFGLAVYLAQVLEKGVLNGVTIAETMDEYHVRPSTPFPDRYDALEAANAKLPLGPLLKKFRRLLSDDEELITALSDALEARNRLAHHFFWEHSEDFLSTRGREEMLAELLLLVEQMQETDRLVTPVVYRALYAAGWTEEALDRSLQDALQRMRARAKGRDV